MPWIYRNHIQISHNFRFHTGKVQMKQTMLILRMKRVKGCLVARSVVVPRIAIKEESQNHLSYVALVDLQVSEYLIDVIHNLENI